MTGYHTTRTASLLLAAAALSACSVAPPTAPTTSTPVAGVPARLDVSAAPGVGFTGGTASIAVRVTDAYATPLSNVSVALQTSVGTLGETILSTDGAGVARTTLTAPAGLAVIDATAASLRATTEVTVQPVAVPPALPPNPPPPVSAEPDPVVSLTARFLSPLAYRVTLSLTPDSAVRSITYTFLAPSALDDVTVGPTTARTIDHTFATAGVWPIRADVTLTNGHVVTTTSMLNVQVHP